MMRYGLDSVLFYKYLILASFLIPIFFIDAFHRLILHVTTFPIIVLGLIFSLVPGNDIGIFNSLFTAIFVFASLAGVSWIYAKLKDREGLGGGDLWLLTGLAAYFGAMAIPWIIILACIMAIIYFFIRVRNRDQIFVFGPFIVIASLAWMLGFESLIDAFNNWILSIGM